jgi:predicted lipoprotein
MSTEASTTVLSKRPGNSSQPVRPKWRRTALIGGVVIVILAIVADTKVIRIGSSEDLRQAAFSPAAYGAKAFPGIKQAIEERAVDASVLQSAIVANKGEATAKYGVAGGSGPVFSVKFTGVASEKPASGVYEIKIADLPDVKVRVQTGPAINGTELRDATGTVHFGAFTNQIEYQNAGSALNNEMKKIVLGAIDTSALAGKTVSVVGAFRLINPKSWLVTPVRLEVQ